MDILKARMHSLVCHASLSLFGAQKCIAQDWEACARKFMRQLH